MKSGLSQQLQHLISEGVSAAAELATDPGVVVASGMAVGASVRVHYFFKLTQLRRSNKSSHCPSSSWTVSLFITLP
jgi:hypothetical protein